MSSEQVGAQLKLLRVAAGYSVRSMADAVGMPKSTYEHWEKRFKGEFLPLEVAIKVADAIAAKGVDRSRALALGGSTVLADAKTLDDRLQELAPRRRQTVLDLMRDLESAEAVDRARQQSTDGGEGKET